MVAYTMPQQRKKEESERLRGEVDQINFIDIRYTRWEVHRILKSKKEARRPVNCAASHSSFRHLLLVSCCFTAIDFSGNF